LRVRISVSGTWGIPVELDGSAHSRADWVRRCKGIGTRKSASATSSRPASLNQRPNSLRPVVAIMELEVMGQFTRDAVVAGDGARVEWRRGNYFGGQRASTGIIGQRNAEPVAQRRPYKIYCAPAGGAQRILCCQWCLETETDGRGYDVDETAQAGACERMQAGALGRRDTMATKIG
jgi:hypothetical protein